MTNKICSLCGASKHHLGRACPACLASWKCKRCGEVRPHGAHGMCKPCQKKVWRDANPGHKDRQHAWFMANKYNITAERYQEMLDRQNGLCAMCQRQAVGRADGSRRFHVDHDHACCPGSGSCGKCVRGILCFSCNQLLGNAKDDVLTLTAAITYLQNVI